MSPANAAHVTVVMRLNKTLMKTFGEDYDIHIQSPVILTDHSEPEPDAMVVRPYQDGEAPYKPTAADVFLVVEVSDTTIYYEQGEKLEYYARAGIPEVWIVDVNRAIIIQYLEPETEMGHYRVSAQWRKEDTISTHPGRDVSVKNILI